MTVNLNRLNVPNHLHISAYEYSIQECDCIRCTDARLVDDWLSQAYSNRET